MASIKENPKKEEKYILKTHLFQIPLKTTYGIPR